MTMRSITEQGVGAQRERDRHEVEAVPDQGGLVVAWGAAGQQDRTGTGPTGPVQSGAAQPVLTPDEVASVISLAARAPSLHNTQPWKFRPRSDCIELLADPDRKLAAVDPAGRELMISCGAAVFGLRLGLRRVGRLPGVALQPDPAQPLLLARVWPAGDAALTPAETDLITAVPHRHTHRGPFSAGEIPARLLDSLVTDASAEGCDLVFISDPQAVGRLGGLVRRAGAEQRANAEMSAELARWVRPIGSQARDGVPATARLADEGREQTGSPGSLTAPRQPDRSAWLARPVPRSRRDPGTRRLPERLAPRDFGLPGTELPGGEPPLVTGVLMTPGDTPADWLRAGQALDRLLLRAAVRWVFASLQSQPTESPRHRRAVRALAGAQGFPQLLLQFGRANTAPATPRRPQTELLVTD
jgi:nitroreductase